MRTIKFRAWENDRMYYQVRCGGEFDGIPTAPTVWSEEHGGWPNLTGQPYTKVMQYTGLCDVRGTEIYEGDIVRFEVFDGLVHVDGFAKVYFEDGSFRLNTHHPLSDYMKNGMVEIIGNIYENPEILRGDSD